MLNTLYSVLNGEDAIFGYYSTAAAYWQNFFATHANSSLATWANSLFKDQISFFESKCGGRDLGQEVMAVSGFTFLYNPVAGFDSNLPLAQMLKTAFDASMCSIEVKIRAKRAADLYGLD